MPENVDERGCQPLNVARDKYWDEQTKDEQIETLFHCLRDAHRQLDAMGETINKLVTHSHDDRGKIVVPLGDRVYCRHFYGRLFPTRMSMKDER